MKKRLKKMMYISLSIIALFIIAIVVFLNQPSFGRLPGNSRMTRMEASPNYQNGKFHNQLPTSQVTDEKSGLQSLYDFLFRKVKDLRPDKELPVMKTDLKQLKKDDNVLVWLGHSSIFMQIDGLTFLLDPVLVMASPVSFINEAFLGTPLYSPEDIPDIDYLLISHDHWDHLDYNTVKSIKNRVGKVITGLGVGEHFEYWGYDKDQIIELDWNEEIMLSNEAKIHILPARHFSGRGLSQDKTLWVSFMLESQSKNIFISGDTGYDTHFVDIARQFPKIDFAIMENGQYDIDWKDIHLMPEDLIKAIKDLSPEEFMTVHNSKYALGKHSWYAPLDNIANAAEIDSLNLITPMIGEIVHLNDSIQQFSKWWIQK